MAQWLQAQLNVATNLLETVDRTISKTVGISGDEGTDGTAADDGLPISSASEDGLTAAARNNFATSIPASQPSAPLEQPTPFIIRQRGPFDAPDGSAPAAAPASSFQAASTSASQPALTSAHETSAIGAAASPEAYRQADTAAVHAPSVFQAGMPETSAAQMTTTQPQAPQPLAAAFVSKSRPSMETPSQQPAPPAPVAPLTAPSAPRQSSPPQPSADLQTPAPTAATSPPAATMQHSNSSAGSTATGPSSAAVTGGAAKLVEQLRKRLEVATAENEQLEEMLKREEQRAVTEAAAAQRLAEELSALQDARAQTEAALQSQLASQQVTSRDLANRLEASNRQVLKLEAQVTALQETAKQLAETRSGLEGGMLDALKSQLEAAEQRLDAECRIHQSTKTAAMARESELEGQLAGSASALADMHRALDEAGVKSRDLEDQVALLQSTCSQLEQQLQQQGGVSAGGAAGGGAQQGADPALVSALRTELSQQQRACQAAEAGKRTAEAALSKVKAEAEGLRAELDKHVARGDVAQLEARLREVSDMLYLKQNQLERLSSDKAAQQLRLERELALAREQATGGGGRYQVDSGGGGGGGRSNGDELIPMDALGAPYQRLAQHDRVGKAVKAAARMLDSTTSSAVFFLRQYPLARILIFAYLVTLHLYIYYLMARLQGVAVRMEGLVDSAGGLPGHSSGPVGHGVAATVLHPHA